MLLALRHQPRPMTGWDLAVDVFVLMRQDAEYRARVLEVRTFGPSFARRGRCMHLPVFRSRDWGAIRGVRAMARRVRRPARRPLDWIARSLIYCLLSQAIVKHHPRFPFYYFI